MVLSVTGGKCTQHALITHYIVTGSAQARAAEILGLAFVGM